VRGIIRREPGREDSTNGEEDDENYANRSQRIALREPWKRNGGGGKVAFSRADFFIVILISL